MLKTLRNKLGLAPRAVLDSIPSLVEFTKRQSAYVSQVTLFGYIKTRAGTSWPKLFEDDTYVISLRTARSHFFAACVSDLSLFFAARMVLDGGISANQAENLAVYITEKVLTSTQLEELDVSEPDALAMISTTAQRASVIDWQEAATSALAFSSSEDAFMRWAPVTDEFKRDDGEIMRNSLHLRWIGIRRDIKETLQIGAVKQGLERA